MHETICETNLRSAKREVHWRAHRRRLHEIEVDDPRARLTPEALAQLTADGEAPTLLIGARVEMVALKGRPELNGSHGTCVSFVKAKGRCAVRLEDAADEAAAPLLLKPCNLRKAAPRPS